MLLNALFYLPVFIPIIEETTFATACTAVNDACIMVKTTRFLPFLLLPLRLQHLRRLIAKNRSFAYFSDRIFKISVEFIASNMKSKLPSVALQVVSSCVYIFRRRFRIIAASLNIAFMLSPTCLNGLSATISVLPRLIYPYCIQSIDRTHRKDHQFRFISSIKTVICCAVNSSRLTNKFSTPPYR